MIITRSVNNACVQLWLYAFEPGDAVPDAAPESGVAYAKAEAPLVAAEDADDEDELPFPLECTCPAEAG